MTLAICLLAVAFGFAMAEITIPSFGLFSLLAAGAYAWSLVEAFTQGATTGWTFVGLGIILLPVAIGLGLKVLPHTPVGRHMMLRGPARKEIKRGSRPDEVHELEGKTGIALSDLRPTGFAKFAEKRIDVVAGGRYILKGTPLRVITIEGNRIVVEEHRETDA